MKALSVRQPHAHRIASGQKTIELRSWRTFYRGELLICAAKGIDDGATDDMPRGVAVCIVELVDVLPALDIIGRDVRQAACVSRSLTEEDWAWMVRLVRPVAPFPIRGRLGLWDVTLAWPPGYFDQVVGSLPNLERPAQPPLKPVLPLT